MTETRPRRPAGDQPARAKGDDRQERRSGPDRPKRVRPVARGQDAERRERAEERGTAQRRGNVDGRASAPRRSGGGSRGPARNAGSARHDRSDREREAAEERDPYGTKSVRPRHRAPDIPDDVEPNQLDRVARAQLKTLSKENADGVARHLVMAARLIESDPVLAHEHAVAAARRAGRIAVVRETLAITAYSTGDFALALRELRTYRRISGRDDQLPMMVDSERGLGRPERALELGRSVPRASLPVEVQVELAIAMSGARLDLGQTDAALLELQIPQLDPDTAYSWSPALFDAYATVLQDLDRSREAAHWLARSEAAAAALALAEDEDEIEVFEEEAAGEPLPDGRGGQGVPEETAVGEPGEPAQEPTDD